MRVIFIDSVLKDLKNIDNHLLWKFKTVILNLEDVANIIDLFSTNFSKLIWSKNYYKIIIWDFRLWIKIINNEVYLLKFLHRKDIYKVFPK